jgi:hypothetical protein
LIAAPSIVELVAEKFQVSIHMTSSKLSLHGRKTQVEQATRALDAYISCIVTLKAPGDGAIVQRLKQDAIYQYTHTIKWLPGSKTADREAKLTVEDIETLGLESADSIPSKQSESQVLQGTAIEEMVASAAPDVPIPNAEEAQAEKSVHSGPQQPTTEVISKDPFDRRTSC